jgi:hypothetical protein
MRLLPDVGKHLLLQFAKVQSCSDDANSTGCICVLNAAAGSCSLFSAACYLCS